MPNQNQSKKPHIVLIGGTKGLGKALAELKSADGHRVSIVARNAPFEPLKSLSGVSFYGTDLFDADATQKTLAQLVKEQGHIDSLVFLQRARVAEQTPEQEWENEFQISLKASRTIVEALKDHFSPKTGGSIVFVSSMGGAFYANSQPLGYAIAKAGFNQMVSYYCAHLGSRQIRVNAVSCFTFLKDESKSFFLQNEKLQQMYRDVVPMQRMPTALDMVKAIRFLTSDDSAFISGQVLVIDGGLSAIGQETVALWASGMAERKV